MSELEFPPCFADRLAELEESRGRLLAAIELVRAGAEASASPPGRWSVAEVV